MMLLTTVALLATLQGTTQGADFRWNGNLAAGKTVEIKGINGAIRAEGTSGRQVEVVAHKTSRRSDVESVEIKVVEHGDGVTICAVYPNQSGEGCDLNSRNSGRSRNGNYENNDVAVEFTVRVPSGVHFVGHTVNGDARASGITGDAEVSTVNGSVLVEAAGNAEGHTVNGDVEVSMGRTDPEGPINVETVNGNVIVTLAGTPNLDVRARTTNGDIETDFPLTVKGRFGPRTLTGTIGSGGKALTLGTVNGDIRIRRRG